MPTHKPKTKLTVIGKIEQLELNRALAAIRSFKIFLKHRNEGEVYFNDLLINHLLNRDLIARNSKIPTGKHFDEQFRPECYLGQEGRVPLLAVECKKLTDATAKARWKEGLSQSLMYTLSYKAVALVLYDYTKKGTYAERMSDASSEESMFAAALKRKFRVYLIVLRPTRIEAVG